MHTASLAWWLFPASPPTAGSYACGADDTIIDIQARIRGVRNHCLTIGGLITVGGMLSTGFLVNCTITPLQRMAAYARALIANHFHASGEMRQDLTDLPSSCSGTAGYAANLRPKYDNGRREHALPPACWS